MESETIDHCINPNHQSKDVQKGADGWTEHQVSENVKLKGNALCRKLESDRMPQKDEQSNTKTSEDRPNNRHELEHMKPKEDVQNVQQEHEDMKHMIQDSKKIKAQNYELKIKQESEIERQQEIKLEKLEYMTDGDSPYNKQEINKLNQDIIGLNDHNESQEQSILNEDDNVKEKSITQENLKDMNIKHTNVTTDEPKPERLTTTDHVDVIKRPYPKIDDHVKYIISFEPDFTNVTEISPISRTKVWVYNLLKLRLVDIERECLLHNYCLEGAFYHLNGLDENNVLFLDIIDNTIVKINMDDGKCINTPFIDVNTRFRYKTKDHIETFMVRKSGEIVVIVEKKHGSYCFGKTARYIQRYNREGCFIREYKLQQNDDSLCGAIFSMTETNEEIYIAFQKDNATGSVVSLNRDFKPHISYEGIAGSTFFPSSLAGTTKDQVLIIVNRQKIDMINRYGNFVQNVPVEGFSPEGSPYAIAVDNENKVWILTDDGKIVCFQLD